MRRTIVGLGYVTYAAGGCGAAEAPEAARMPPSAPESAEAQVALLTQQVEARVRANTTPIARRDAHPKSHGCVKARLTVPADVAPDLKAGLFAEPATYAAWVRFSNGSGVNQPDAVGDGRGMAIKVLGVPDGGGRAAPEALERSTQDFVLINHPVFFVKDLADYVQFVSRGAAFLAEHPREASILAAISDKYSADPLEDAYYSMVPVSLGARAIKVQATPCASLDDPNYLATALRAHLQGEPQASGCFVLRVQLQGEPVERYPIDDATARWDEAGSPYREVARLTLPQQSLTGREQLCEDLSFNPWHAMVAHTPLGSIQAARRVVYSGVSLLRHTLNGAPQQEPAAPPDIEAWLAAP